MDSNGGSFEGYPGEMCLSPRVPELRVSQGARIRVRPGCSAFEFSAGDKGVVTRADHDSSFYEVMFDCRSAPLMVALRHVELDEAAIDDSSPQLQEVRRQRSRSPSASQNGSSASVGIVERGIQSIQGQVRPMKDCEADGLRVVIAKAHGLAHIGMTGEATHCTCEVLHPHTGDSVVHKTRTSRNTQSPVWNQSFKFSHYHPGETVVFCLRDEVAGKCVQTSMPSDHFYPAGCEIELRLGDKLDAVLLVRVTPELRSQAPPTVAHVAMRAPVETSTAVAAPAVALEGLNVMILQAAGLMHLNMSGESTRCTCEIRHPHTGDSVLKETSQARNTKSPVWNQTLEFRHYEPGESLVFSIFDEVTGTHAQTLLPADHFYPDGCISELWLDEAHDATLLVKVWTSAARMPSSTGYSEARIQKTREINMIENAFERKELEEPTHREVGPLTVVIIRAIGLEHLRMTGKSTRCTCEIRHAETGEVDARETWRSRNTKAPVWNQYMEFSHYEAGETLIFSIRDEASGTCAQTLLPADHFVDYGCEAFLQLNGHADAKLLVRVVLGSVKTLDRMVCFRCGWEPLLKKLWGRRKKEGLRSVEDLAANKSCR